MRKGWRWSRLAAGLALFTLASAVVSKVEGQSWNNVNNQYRLSADDQRRFDDYYSKWMQNRQRRDRGEIASMEVRMLNIYRKYSIPSSTPYEQVASRNLVNPGNVSYSGRLRGDEQSRF